MGHSISHTNTGFAYLHKSSDFLNLILENITSCILMLDKDINLIDFNDAFRSIFSDKPQEYIRFKKCGNAIGCAFAVDEEAECGTTTHCRYCSLRESVLHSYMKKEPVFKMRIDREFYTTDSKKEMRNLQFSTRPFYFEKEYYIIVIIEDITKFIRLAEELSMFREDLSHRRTIES